MPSVSLSMLLYWVSALVQLLLANAIGHSAALSGASFLGNHILFLTCIILAPSLTPNASVSKYNCSLLLHNAMVAFFWWCFWLCHVRFDVLFQVYSHLKRSAFLMVFHTFAIGGKMYTGSWSYLKWLLIFFVIMAGMSVSGHRFYGSACSPSLDIASSKNGILVTRNDNNFF